MELATSALALGKIVGERAGKAWLTSHAAEADRGKDLVELIQAGFVDQIHGRRVGRQIDEIADQVAERIIKTCSQEYRGLPDSDKASAVQEVKDTFARADLSDAVLFAADADPEKLAASLRAQLPRKGRAAQLGEGGARIYEVVLVDCCECLIRIVRELAQFVPRAQIEMLARLSELSEHVNAVLTRLPPRVLDAPEGEAGDEGFRRRYLETISGSLDALELFGVRVDRYRPRTTLSVAYISLTVSPDETTRQRLSSALVKDQRHTPWAEAPDEYVPGSVRVETALSRSRLALIRGEAGSGKSTLIRWIAISAARSSFTGDLAALNGYTPFLVKLRSFADVRLPRPEELLEEVAGLDLSLMPRGWIHRQLATGRAVLLVDGVDELKAAQRGQVREWLAALLTTYPEIHVVVTSRPAAADAKWLASEGFASVYLERMSPADVKLLIHHWHEAARDMKGLPCEPERLPGFEAALLTRLETTPHLRVLATSPLLAAMLCALNLDHDTHLPRDRMGLYSATIEMLLARREMVRGIDHEAPMTVDQTVHILQDLAWRLCQSNRSELPKEVVLRRITDRLSTMPLRKESPELVLRELLERSGILREPVIGRIDFVHRSVQEYLAAKHIADDSDMESLIAVAHQDQWRDTIVMAAGHANAVDRGTLMRGLLERAEREPRRARQFKLLVGACLETIQSIEPALRGRIEGCLEELIPPRSMVAADSLATLGEPVLEKLPERIEELSVAQARAVIRTAYLVNGPAAMDKLELYKSDGRDSVQSELINGWDYFDPATYARRILADARLVRGMIHVSDHRLLPHLRHLEGLSSLHLSGIVGADELSLVAELSARLRVLRVFSAMSGTSLEPLAILAPSLRYLYVGGGPLRDFASMTRLVGLKNLSINVKDCDDIGFVRPLGRLREMAMRSGGAVLDLHPLQNLADLDNFRLTDFPALVVPDQLPDLAQARTVSLIATGLKCSLDEIVRRTPSAERLYLSGMEAVVDISAVSLLDARKFSFDNCVNVVDLSPLAKQVHLEYLDVSATGVTDLKPLAELTSLSYLRIGRCKKVVDLEPLAGLGSLRRLSVTGCTPGLDLTPLAGNKRLTIEADAGLELAGAELFGDRLDRI